MNLHTRNVTYKNCLCSVQKRLFIAVLIPGDSPKGNHFWTRELIAFLKNDYMNIKCIKARIVLLIFTFHATVFPHCYSVQNASIGYQGVIYSQGV